MNEDPQALNYDPQHKIIRSMFSGSRGPLLRKATGLDWAGDPIEVKGRFRPGHGEESYDQMVAHFKDYNDIIGDHPQNLLAPSSALNAYLLTGASGWMEPSAEPPRASGTEESTAGGSRWWCPRTAPRLIASPCTWGLRAS